MFNYAQWSHYEYWIWKYQTTASRRILSLNIWSQHFYHHNLVLCVFLFKDTSFNIILLQIINYMVFEWFNNSSFGNHLCYTGSFVNVLVNQASLVSTENLLFLITLFLYSTYQVFLKILPWTLLSSEPASLANLTFFTKYHLWKRVS